MNQKRKNIIIVVALLLVTNLITNYVSSNKDAILGKKTTVTVASVDGKEFSSNDMYKEWKSNGQETSAINALLTSVDKYILDEKYGDSKEIKETVETQSKQIKASFESQGTDFNEALASSGMTEEEWKESLAQQVATEKLTKKYVEGLVTKEQVQEAYDAEEDKVKSSQILFKAVPSEGQAVEQVEQEAKAQADQVYAELTAALNDSKDKEKTFAEFAKEYSQDEDSKDKGGDLGYSNSEDTLYTEALDKLEVGSISEVVKTNYGYAIIMKTDVKEKKSLDKESVYKKYEQQVADKMLEEKESAYTELAKIDFRESKGLKFKDSDLGETYSLLIEQANSALEEEEEGTTLQ